MSHTGMTGLRIVAIVVPLATGCFTSGGPPPVCTTPPQYTIDTGASLSYGVGVDAGYYAAYRGSGQWHFEWTCDTKLSAEGCNFTGTITMPAGATATGFMLESDDVLGVTPGADDTVAQFDTITTTGIDGVDLTTTAGAAVTIDFQVNGLYQNDLVFVPSDGEAITPACMPATLTPSAP